MRPRAPVQIASGVGVFVAVVMLLRWGPLVAQQPNKESSLSPQEKHGQMLLLQKCSICHLPPLAGPTQSARLPFGPLLYGLLDNAENESRVREVIRLGGAQMPGFQYDLQPGEIDDIVAYLKSSQMKVPPQWFADAQARGTRPGRGPGSTMD